MKLDEGSIEFKGLKNYWNYQASQVSNMKDLQLLYSILFEEDYEHDYGTIVHAISAFMKGAFNAANRSKQGGITGFQASFIGWSMVSEFLSYDEEVGARLIDYGNLLYPQYWENFLPRIPNGVWQRAQEKAKRLLEENDIEKISPHVLQHWKKIANGEVPFGLTISPVWPDYRGERLMRDLIRKVDKLAELVSELKQQIQEEGQSDTDNGQPGADSNKINWELMPEDTLVLNNYGDLRHFSCVADGRVYAFPDGVSSMTYGGAAPLFPISKPRLAKNQPWRPWFGGECPVDPNVRVDYILRNAQSSMDRIRKQAGDLLWGWDGGFNPNDIIAWRIADEQEKAQ
jgi:hypothetical protein